MATLAPTPQDLIEEMTHKKGEDFKTYMKRSQAAFDRLIEESEDQLMDAISTTCQWDNACPVIKAWQA